MKTYAFKMRGTAAGEQTWEANGHVEGLAAQFNQLVDLSMRQSFDQLTNGKAVFGKPGVGCKGPYAITHFSLDLVDGGAT